MADMYFLGLNRGCVSQKEYIVVRVVWVRDEVFLRLLELLLSQAE